MEAFGSTLLVLFAPLFLSGAKREPARPMIAFHAAMELVHPERRQPYQALAPASKMRKADYIRVHQAITAELQELMNNASREFGGRLWGLFD